MIEVAVLAGDQLPMQAWVAGRPAGFAVDYARLLAGRLGMRLEFRPFTNLEAVAFGGSSEPPPFDLLLGLVKSEVGEGRFDFLTPYETGPLILVTRKGDEQIRDEHDLNHTRIVIERPFRNLAVQLAERYPQATQVFANDGRQAMDMLTAGQADAYLGTPLARVRALLNERASDDLAVMTPTSFPALSIAMAILHGHPMLVQLLRKAEASVAAEDLDSLRERWGLAGDVNLPTPAAAGLSADDRSLLKALPPLRVGFETDRFPYTFLNGQGHFDGLAADYVEILRQELGLRIQPVPANDSASLQRMVRANEVDMVVAAMPEDFRVEDMIFSRPYEHFPEVIVANANNRSIAGPEDLAEHVVAAREETVPRLQLLMPHSRLLPVGSNEAGLGLVAAGRADAYIGTLPAIDNLIRNRYTTLRIMGPSGDDQDFTVGLNRRYGHLMPLINRLLAGVKDRQRMAIRSRWLTTEYYYGVPWKWVVLGILVAVAILAIIGFAYTRLRRLMRARELAEQELALQLAFQQALLESIPYPVFVKDAEGRYIAVNRAYETMFECSRTDLLGRTLIETRHARDLDAEALHQADMEVLSQGGEIRRELHLSTLRGTDTARDVLLWLHTFLRGSDQGVGLLGTVVDVSDLRKAEARATASEQRLHDTNDSLPGVVLRARYSVDGNATYEYISGPVEALLGLTYEEMMQGPRRPFDVMPLEDRPLVQETIEQLLAGRAPEKVEFRVNTATGVRWVRASVGMPRSEAPGTVSCSIFCTDITREKEQAQALVEAKAVAEAAVAAKSAFLAMMSHEIRTPMAGVLGLIELLDKTPLDREQAHMIDMVHDSAGVLLQILDDILDFSRIEAGRLILDIHPFDLRALADGVLGLFASRAQEKGVRLYAVLDWRLAAEYQGDMTRVRQIITNLLSNALKFTEKGHVELRIEFLGESAEGHRLSIAVMDTGIGISEEQLGRLFHPFVQAEISTTRRYGGTGLGLSISNHLAQMMGGQVRLTSAVGFGTQATFEVLLPVQRALQPQPAMAGKAALLCTRDLMLERELSNVFSAMGMSVVGADANDLGDFSANDVDLFAVDADLARGGVLPDGARVIQLIDSPDPRGFYVDDGQVKLSGHPLLWRSAVEACHAVLGLTMPQRTAASATAVATHAARILVAEDHPTNRAVISRQLERLGYTHTIVENGLQALEALASEHYDLLITDCHMPVLDGFALARRIREREKGGASRLPIVALSASALPEEVTRCRAAGMDEFLAKPVKLDDLGAMLSACLAHLPSERPRAEVSGAANTNPRIRTLLEVFGSTQQVTHVLRGLLDASRKDLMALDQAVQRDDREAQRDILHRIHGALRLLGDNADESAGEDATQRQALVGRLDALEALLEELERHQPN
ncbi:transporter substrate-binding domain-containing protein [Dyella halodurans]|uniref:histidine kinase n=1 Tax=Dyella halodurans TaxID=1920171 RepID=A0ABV9BZM9_9GAMM|nr:transporter substrate-binding domain-containing protein [Dyella halodurans]